MAKVLYNVTWPGPAPTVEQVRERMGLGPDDLDADFGVIAVTPEEGVYAIMVEDAAMERVSGQPRPDQPSSEGPFANPPIEPFGPPQ